MADPAPTEIAAGPLTVAQVEGSLRAMDGSLRLVATTRTDESGAFPALAFDAQSSTPPTDLAPHVGLVLVYPTTADRVAMQPSFGWSGMSGPKASITADGIVHSEWVGFENVLVEAVMPGGTMGGRTPTPDEAHFPGQVRAALDAFSGADASPIRPTTPECVTVGQPPVEVGPGTTADQVAGASLIFVGAFNGYGSAAWNTLDGRRPPRAITVQDLARTSAWISRPLQAVDELTLIGNGADLANARVLGGRVGCDSYPPSLLELLAGGRYVFFLHPVSDADGLVRDNLALSMAYPVAEDDTVTRPTELPIDLPMLVDQIRAGTARPPERKLAP